MADDPNLPPLQTVSEWIRETRHSLDMTLSELGEEAHLSPSQLSRIENSEGNPSYEAIYRVYRELKRRKEEASVAEVLRRKRDRYDTLTFEYVTPDDTCARAAHLMDEYDISQLPVLDGDRAVGSITDTALMELENDPAEVTITDCSLPPFPEVPVTEHQATVRNLLRQNAAVLLTQANNLDQADTSDQADNFDFSPVVGPYVGLVTAADFR